MNTTQTFGFRAVYSAQCITIGRIVSGDAPPGSDPASLQAPDLYPIGAGAPNYTVVASEGRITCDQGLVFNNSLVGESGQPEDRMFSAFTEKCPDLFPILPDDYTTPQDHLGYNCSKACVDWMINLGVCAVTDLKAVRSPFSFVLSVFF
jgi:hypothetical protein